MTQTSDDLAYLQKLGILVWVPVECYQQSSLAIQADDVGATTTQSAPVAKTLKADPKLSKPNWPGLKRTVADCTACALHKGRSQVVFGVGDDGARLMVIGEAPGVDEDRVGEPFVGRAGQLLNAMLQAIAYPRESVYIANVIKCRPPNNRTPQPEEIQHCLGFLEQQIALVKPQAILLLGKVAAHALLKTNLPLGQLRGPQQYLEIPVIVTYHPAYLLRNPLAKKQSWEDLKQLKGLMQSVSINVKQLT